MKRNISKIVGIALIIAGSFGLGMLFMRYIDTVDLLFKFIEVSERIFK